MTGDLQFDAATHSFTWRGNPVPGVSQILRDMGLSQSYYKLDPVYRERGSAVHQAAQYICEGAFDRDNTHPDLLPYTDGFQQFVADTGFKLLPGSEVPIYSPSLRIAGIPDMPGMLPGEEAMLLDIKTGEQAPKGVQLQLALYRMLLAGGVNIRGEQVQMDLKAGVRCLLLPKTGRYKLMDFSDAKYMTYANSAVSLWHLRNSWGLLNGRSGQ